MYVDNKLKKVIAMDKTRNTGMLTLNYTSVIDPSEMVWGLQDVSASDAGRDEAIRMHKLRVGQIRTYQLTWNMIDPFNASVILKAINAKEEFYCKMFDPMENDMRMGLYYVGDRTAPFKQWIPDREDGKVYSKLSFTLIEVMPDSDKTLIDDGTTTEGATQS